MNHPRKEDRHRDGKQHHGHDDHHKGSRCKCDCEERHDHNFDIRKELLVLKKLLLTVIEKETEIMATMQDLETEVSNMGQDVTELGTKVDQAIALIQAGGGNGGGNGGGDTQPVIDAVVAVRTDLRSTIDKLTAVVPDPE